MSSEKRCPSSNTDLPFDTLLFRGDAFPELNNLPFKLPFIFHGKVVHGYGRGGRDLDCPTANIDVPKCFSWTQSSKDGVYVGYAKVDKGPLYPMLMSFGNNPHFGNKEKSVEIYLFHEFEEDFYGRTVRTVVIGYLREMKKFNSIDELKQAITKDKEDALVFLREKNEFEKWLNVDFFADSYPLKYD